MDSLHELIVNHACRKGGWQRGGNVKAAFRAKCRENDMWQGEFESNNNGQEIWSSFRRIPDAWRFVVEDQNTPGMDWNYPVLVVEFLEVEIDHPMDAQKRRDYIALWWGFDGTGCFHFRVYRQERYGAPVLWLDTETVLSEEAIVR